MSNKLDEIFKSQRQVELSPLEKLAASLVGVVVALVAFAVTIAYSIFSQAYVVYWYWVWFIIPYFHCEKLSYVNAAGISVLITFMTFKYMSWRGEDKRTSKQKIIEQIGIVLRPWAFLLIGYLLSKLM